MFTGACYALIVTVKPGANDIRFKHLEPFNVPFSASVLDDQREFLDAVEYYEVASTERRICRATPNVSLIGVYIIYMPPL